MPLRHLEVSQTFGGKRDAQRVEDRGKVNDFLGYDTSDRRQVAQGGGGHSQNAQSHSSEGALCRAIVRIRLLMWMSSSTFPSEA